MRATDSTIMNTRRANNMCQKRNRFDERLALPIVILALGAFGCDGPTAVSTSNSAALSSSDGPQPDLVIGGRRYIWLKKATFVSPPPERGPITPTESPTNKPSTAQEVAAALRPRILKDGH